MTATINSQRVYKLSPAEGYEWVVPGRNEPRKLTGLPNQPLQDAWTPIDVELVSPGEGEPVRRSDFPWANHEVLVLRENAATSVGPLLADGAEFLPLRAVGAELSLLHVFVVLDALVEHRSRFVRFPSTGRIMKIKSHVFDPAVLGEATFFKIPQLKSSPIYCTERVARWLQESGLEGLKLELVFDAGS